MFSKRKANDINVLLVFSVWARPGVAQPPTRSARARLRVIGERGFVWMGSGFC